MSTITVISRNLDVHVDLMRQLKQIEIGHIRKQLQRRENNSFAQSVDPETMTSDFKRASKEKPQAITYKDATLHYDMEQLSVRPRIDEHYHRDFGIVYEQNIVCRMSVYEAMERFNHKDKATFLWLGGKGRATLFSDLRLAAAYEDSSNVKLARAVLFEPIHP